MKRLDKLKNDILNYIKDNFKEIIFLIIFTCFCFYDTGYSIYKPGGIINVDERIKGDNLYKSEGSFNMAYVGFMEGKAPIYLFAKLMPNWEIVKNEDSGFFSSAKNKMKALKEKAMGKIKKMDFTDLLNNTSKNFS